MTDSSGLPSVKRPLPEHMRLEINHANSLKSHQQPVRPWLVQKFGGTSIGKFIETITGTIV
ncbi:hypothetical protein BX616_008393, partial [Lobosporangium transversale]